MPTSDEELARLREQVEEKRNTLATTRAEREAAARSSENDIAAAELLAEAARLDVQIAEEQSILERSQGENPSLRAARESMELAVRQQEQMAENTRVQAEIAEADKRAADEAAVAAAANEPTAIDAEAPPAPDTIDTAAALGLPTTTSPEGSVS